MVYLLDKPYRKSSVIDAEAGGTSRIYLQIGQSHGIGYGKLSDNVTTRWYQDGLTYGLHVFDKFKRPNRNDITLVDSNRDDEVHGFKPLRPGWGDGDDSPDYNWEAIGSDPAFGPEMQFMTECKRRWRRPIYLVKYCIAGSQLYDRAGIPDWNVANVGSGNQSNLQIAMDAYWAPALAACAALSGGLSQVTIGGVICWIGTTDAKDEAWATAYEANLRAVIDYVRSYMNPTSPTSVPWLQMMTPYYLTPPGFPGEGEAAGYVEMVRAAQLAVTDKTNVVAHDVTNFTLGPDGVHFDSRSNNMAGQAMFRKLEPFAGVLAG